MTAPRRVRIEGDRFHPRIPEGSVYVGRPAPYLPGSKFANPWSTEKYPLEESLRLYREHLETCPAYHTPRTPCELFRCWNPETLGEPSLAELARVELAGREVACRCPLDQDCHADILLGLLGGSGP